MSPHELDVCLLSDGPGPLPVGGLASWAGALRDALPGVAVGIAPAGAALPPARLYHALTPAAAAAAGPHLGGRPLVVSLHAMKESWRPAGWRGPLPLDSSQGGNGIGWGVNPDGPPKTASARAGYAPADVIVAVSRAVAESHVAAGAPSDRVVVIPNGAPAPGPVAAVAPQPWVGFVGRLAPVKGIERLMDAMRLVRAERPDARLVLMGPDDGPPGYADALRRRARRPGLAGAVAFTGAGRPERLLPLLSVLALASETEGMPLALLEAMAHGLACVAPDVGGCAEALGDAGLVVPPRDTDALAGAILALLDDTGRRDDLGRRARERAAGWTAADGARAYAQIYAGLAP